MSKRGQQTTLHSLLKVRLTPRGGRDALIKYEQGVLFARVASPPVEGAANRALIVLLAETLHLPKSAINLHSGETGRDKVLHVEGVDADTLRARIESAINIPS